MFNATTLYGLDERKTNEFLSNLVSHFNLYFFTFYGDLEVKKRQLIEEIQKLAKSSKNKIAFIDFLEPNDFLRNYLYSDWDNHCPDGIRDETKRVIQIQYERPIEQKERKCLENLFYYCLFGDPFINPCICFVDIRNGYLVERIIEDTSDRDIIESISRILELIDENPRNNIFDSKDEIGNLFRPKRNFFRSKRFNYNPRNSDVKINIEKVFAKFIDTIEDALTSLNDDEISDEICHMEIECNRKFKSKFKKLDRRIKEKACECIKILFKEPNKLNIKPIPLSKNDEFFRMWINYQYRIHFKGSWEEPKFINIGPHKLTEYNSAYD